MTPAAAPGFLPSRDGFAFTNSWPAAPAVRVRTPLGSIGIGNAAAGLCGGMVFAALDFWHARTVPPTQRPAPGSPLYRFVVRRLVDSWHIPAGVARYYRWMNLPDGDNRIDLPGRRPAARRGMAWRTIVVHWPRIKASLDDGIPAALGLVTMASANPLELGHNHQVLACGYTLSDNKVTIAVYDPNSGSDDDVRIEFDTSAPARPTTFSHNLNLGRPVRGFFLTAYSPVAPPGFRARPPGFRAISPGS